MNPYTLNAEKSGRSIDLFHYFMKGWSGGFFLVFDTGCCLPCPRDRIVAPKTLRFANDSFRCRQQPKGLAAGLRLTHFLYSDYFEFLMFVRVFLAVGWKIDVRGDDRTLD